MNYESKLEFLSAFTSMPYSKQEAVAVALSQTVVHSGASLAVIVSEDGSLAATVCKFRPAVPVVVITSQDAVVRSLRALYGQHPCREQSLAGDPGIAGLLVSPVSCC